MAVDLLLYSEAHLIHHQNLTADIWVRLVKENLIKVKALDAKMVSRMRRYARDARFVISMNQYITERWEEDWWRRLKFDDVSYSEFRLIVLLKYNSVNRICIGAQTSLPASPETHRQSVYS